MLYEFSPVMLFAPGAMPGIARRSARASSCSMRSDARRGTSAGDGSRPRGDIATFMMSVRILPPAAFMPRRGARNLPPPWNVPVGQALPAWLAPAAAKAPQAARFRSPSPGNEVGSPQAGKVQQAAGDPPARRLPGGGVPPKLGCTVFAPVMWLKSRRTGLAFNPP